MRRQAPPGDRSRERDTAGHAQTTAEDKAADGDDHPTPGGIGGIGGIEGILQTAGRIPRIEAIGGGDIDRRELPANHRGFGGSAGNRLDLAGDQVAAVSRQLIDRAGDKLAGQAAECDVTRAVPVGRHRALEGDRVV